MPFLNGKIPKVYCPEQPHILNIFRKSKSFQHCSDFSQFFMSHKLSRIAPSYGIKKLKLITLLELKIILNKSIFPELKIKFENSPKIPLPSTKYFM
jgi:hypothetical protein